MDDDVSSALQARLAGPEGLKKMLLVSATAHVVLMTLAALAPASLRHRPIDARTNVVTIDLGPEAGADSGGRTSIGARPVQRAVPDPPAVRPTHPPAAKTPESVLPEVKRAASVSDAPKDASSRKPIAGSEVRAGSAPAGAATQSNSTGLSTTTDGGGTGAQVNVGDFCCPDYIATMLRRVHQHWNAGSGANAVATMQFTIQRDGSITHVQLMRSSGNQMLDFLAERALLAVRQLPPLPEAYTNPSLDVTLEFKYQR